MLWNRIIVATFAGVLLLHPGKGSFADEKKKDEVVKSVDRATEVVELTHADAYSVADSIRHLGLNVKAVAVSESRLILTGRELSVQHLLDKILPQIDVASATDLRTVSEVLPIGSALPASLLQLVHTVSGRNTQIAMDQFNRMLAVRGTREQLDAVRELVSQLNRTPQTLTMHFTFLRGRVGHEQAQSPSKLPKHLAAVSEALAANGIVDLSVLAPVAIRASQGEGFESHGKLRPSSSDSKGYDELGFSVQGKSHLQSDEETVHLEVAAEVQGRYSRPEFRGEVMFSVQTTVTAKLGTYTVLATSPSTTAHGDVIALVLQVTEK